MGTKNKGESPGRGREILGIGLLGLGVFCTVSLVSMQAGRDHMMGPGGAAAATYLYSFAGLCSYLLVFAGLVVAIRLCRAQPLMGTLVQTLGYLSFLCSAAILLHLPFAGDPVTLRGPGGMLGQWLAEGVGGVVGGVGAALAGATGLSIALMLLTHVRVSEVLAVLAWGGRHAGRALWATACAAGWMAVKGGRALGRMVVAMFPEKDEKETKAEEQALADAEAPWDDLPEEDGPVVQPAVAMIEPMPEADSDLHMQDDPEKTIDFSDLSEGLDSDTIFDEPPVVHESEDRRAMAALVAEVAAVECAAPAGPEIQSREPVIESKPEPAIVPAVTAALDEGVTERSAAPFDDEIEAGPVIVQPVKREESAEQPAADDGLGYVRLSDGAFQLPSTDLLEYNAPEGGPPDEKTLKAMAARLELAMGNYGVRGNVTAIQMGPVITTFEFAPAPGTRTGKIVQLENDLAMALEAQSVRIVAPIPGKAVVGVELPNKNRETVYLKEILEDDSFRKATSKMQ
ncbi:MAG TPA: DNA translocase FtsK 4TM domain-containing protein, partial [Polyangia bacterium]